MDDLPLYGVGISAGSAFLLKMPRYMRVRGWQQTFVYRKTPAATVMERMHPVLWRWAAAV